MHQWQPTIANHYFWTKDFFIVTIFLLLAQIAGNVKKSKEQMMFVVQRCRQINFDFVHPARRRDVMRD
jgi:hypothetical protein